MLIFLIAAGASALAFPVQAQDYWTPEIEARLSPAYRQCMKSKDASQGVHGAMMTCGNAENIRLEARVNAAYRAARVRLSRERRASLRDLQRDWLKEREATCQAAFDRAGGGQASELEQSGCRSRETIVRTMWLEGQR